MKKLIRKIKIWILKSNLRHLEEEMFFFEIPFSTYEREKDMYLDKLDALQNKN